MMPYDCCFWRHYNDLWSQSFQCILLHHKQKLFAKNKIHSCYVCMCFLFILIPEIKHVLGLKLSFPVPKRVGEERTDQQDSYHLSPGVTPTSVGLSSPLNSIPPSSPTSSFSSSAFICLCSLQFLSVEIRVKHQPAWREKVRERERMGERERESERVSEKTDNKSSMGFIFSCCVSETTGNKEEKTAYRV